MTEADKYFMDDFFKKYPGDKLHELNGLLYELSDAGIDPVAVLRDTLKAA